MCGTTTTTNDLGLTDKNNACACGHHQQDATSSITGQAPDAGVIREHYLVNGMTCEHCVASVTEEVSEIEGVQNVRVDLHAGGTSTVMIESAAPIAREHVDAAVTEAGYTLVEA
jgi:copper chaperone CopZ